MTHDAPIIMSAPMVLACLRQVRGEPGGKTVTRRMPTKQWGALERRFLAGEPLRLWVRESWCVSGRHDDKKPTALDPRTMTVFMRAGGSIANQADGTWSPHDYPFGHIPDWVGIWRPSMFMPRWASRLTLLDVTVRRERLGDISDEDARAEGIEPVPYTGNDPQYIGQVGWKSYEAYPDGTPHQHSVAPNRCAVKSYQELWDKLHGHGAWKRDRDEQVMVIGFRPVLANIDQIGEAP